VQWHPVFVPFPLRAFASTNELSTCSLRPSHRIAGRVPSPGACIEDRRRAEDRQFIAAKHPLSRGSVLRVSQSRWGRGIASREAAKGAKKGGGSRRFLSLSPEAGRGPWPPMNPSACLPLRVFASSREPKPVGAWNCLTRRREGREEMRGREPRTRQPLCVNQSSMRRRPSPPRSTKACGRPPTRTCPTLVPLRVFASTNELRTGSLSRSHAAVGRVPSPGACIEDRRRAEDRQFIAAKHPLSRGSVLRVSPLPSITGG
jgi:hypothetical protein